jgi:hypothetical protein
MEAPMPAIRTPITSLIVCLLVALPHAAAAQETGLPSPGQRIRVADVSGSGHRVVGSVVRSDGDTIGIATDSGSVFAIPGHSLSRYEVSRGMRSGFGRGLGLGAMAGAIGGSLIGLAAANNDDFCNSACGLVGGAVLFGAAGAVVGGIVGASSHYEKWEKVDRTGPRLVVRPGTADRVDVGLSFRW